MTITGFVLGMRVVPGLKSYLEFIVIKHKKVKQRRHQSTLQDVFTLPPLLTISGVFPPSECVTLTALVAFTGRQVFSVFSVLHAN